MLNRVGGSLYISSTRKCNIDCEYCHIPKEVRENSIVEPDKVLRLVSRLRDQAVKHKIFYENIVFTGAETTLLPAKVLAELGNISNEFAATGSMQSNLIRFADDEYFDEFFKYLRAKTNFGISTTLDGPAIVHNKNRDNSYSPVVKAISKLKAKGFVVNILCTITKHTVEHLDEFIPWAVEMAKVQGNYIRFRLVEGKDNVLSNPEMRKYINAMIDAGLDQYMASFRDNDVMTSGTGCTILEFEEDGSAFPCNTDRDLTSSFANIYETELDEIIALRSKVFLDDKFSLHPDCLTCPKLEECHGGCPIYRVDGKANDCFVKRASIGKVTETNPAFSTMSSYSMSKAIEFGKRLIVQSPNVVWSLTPSSPPNFKAIVPQSNQVCFNCACDMCVCACDCVSMPTPQDISDEWERTKSHATDIAEDAQRYGQDIIDAGRELVDIATGQFARDKKDVEQKIARYEDEVDDYDKYIDSLARLEVFRDEILNMVSANRSKEAYAKIKKLQTEILQVIDNFKHKYRYTIELSRGDLGGIILFIPMVIGGLISDLEDVLFKGDWEAGKRILNTTLQILGIIITLIAFVITSVLSIVFPVLLPVAIALGVGLISQIASLVISLDSMYNQGLLMGNLFMALDLIFNQILGFDEWLSRDFSKLGDAEYYAELTGYVQIGLAIVTALSALVAWVNAPASGSQAAMALNSAMAGSGELSQLLALVNTAMTAGDIAEAYKKSKELEDTLKAKKAELDERIATMHNNKMVQAYAETEDMLNNTNDIVANYVMSGFESPTSTFDPEMTIVANFGYRRTNDNIMSFGFEDVFKENINAGDRNYVRNILYRI